MENFIFCAVATEPQPSNFAKCFRTAILQSTSGREFLLKEYKIKNAKLFKIKSCTVNSLSMHKAKKY